ncbi:hypothetical protein [Mesorhizobium sp. M0222]
MTRLKLRPPALPSKSNPDGLHEVLRAVMQEVLEAEMEEALDV